jgi:hypothetical protein
MAGLLDDMNEAQRNARRKAETHNPAKKVTAREMADAMQAVGLLASPIPVVGDVAGLLGDAAMYAAKPEERTWGNAGMTMLGALPFFPSALGRVKAPALRRVFHGSPTGEIKGIPNLAAHEELNISNAFSTTTSRKIADMYAQGLLGFQGPGPSPAVTEFLLHGDVPSYSKTYNAAIRDAASRGEPIDFGLLNRYAAKKGIKAVQYSGDGVREIVVLDPSALLQTPNKSPLR